jgi:hypothetical protein
MVAMVILAGRISASELEPLASNPLGIPPAFEPVSNSRLVTAAAKLREAMGPLDAWLSRSQSGEGWRTYLDWPALEQQAASAQNADVDTLARIYRRLDSGAEGLELARFAAVRRALGLKPGMRVQVRVEGKRALITPAPAAEPASLKDIQALLAYEGPPVAVDDMRVTHYEG